MAGNVKGADDASPLDVHFGRRLMLRRQALELDQDVLAKMVGLTAEDIDTLEGGHRRFDGTLIYRLSRILEVPVYWFYEGVGSIEQILLESLMPGTREASDHAADEIARGERAKALMSYFEGLDAERQGAILDIARLMASDDTDKSRQARPLQ
jgi:transcriptional regulator with XRE-family HTH domain